MRLLSPEGVKSDSPGWKRSATPGNHLPCFIDQPLIITHLHHAIRKHKNILTAKTQRALRKTRNPNFSAASLRTWRLCGKNSLLLPISVSLPLSYSVFFRVLLWLILLLRQPSLTLPALNAVFSFRVRPWLMLLLLPLLLGLFK